MERMITLEVVETDTVLLKVIQAAKKRRMVIRKLIAEETARDYGNAFIKILGEARAEQYDCLKKQFEKIIDVVEVTVL